YLAQLDLAAPEQKFPLVRRWIDTEPLAFFKELRESRPILETPVCTLVTRFDDVTEVLAMPKIFTAALYLPKMGNGIYLMAHHEAPRRDRSAAGYVHHEPRRASGHRGEGGTGRARALLPVLSGAQDVAPGDGQKDGDAERRHRDAHGAHVAARSGRLRHQTPRD